ncbi:class I SAM-dependent methyltransferase [Sphingomonas sp.]|uniref:class I SAM-dependent methyltransferase n=1 Tax=Sphingomonas sp. TaxID=28214 RepID=UPI0025FD549E|nr:class I SAM-dependent methyltransferase [Sphingomonas sp.]
MVAIERHAAAWTEFWNEQKEAAGCCASAPEIRRPITRHWTGFAQSLVAGSHVLDLACGTGAAGRALVAANPSLCVTGIDFAMVPACREPQIEILPAIKMEQLPFADGSFDAAVSQFGFEYGAVDMASVELARVLRRGAPFSLLVHHSAGRIAKDSINHRQALQLISGAAMEAAFLSGDDARLDRQLAHMRRQYPHERIIDEAGNGFRRMIAQSAAHRAEIWQAVRTALEPELVMLADLAEAAVSPDMLPAWLSHFDHRLKLQQTTVLTMSNGHTLCWKVEGVRRTGLQSVPSAGPN